MKLCGKYFRCSHFGMILTIIGAFYGQRIFGKGRKMNGLRLLAVMTVVIGIGVRAGPVAAQTFTYSTIENPSGFTSVEPKAIDGTNIVGQCSGPAGVGGDYGFLYDGSTWTKIDDALGYYGTCATGVSGNNVVGWYTTFTGQQYGFLYNGSTYTTLSDPLGTSTTSFGISGNNVVGQYYAGGWKSFLYDGSSWLTLNDPLGANGTFAYGISGNDIVGSYRNSSECILPRVSLRWLDVDDARLPIGWNKYLSHRCFWR